MLKLLEETSRAKAIESLTISDFQNILAGAEAGEIELFFKTMVRAFPMPNQLRNFAWSFFICSNLTFSLHISKQERYM